jgi:hypothetical protein
MEKGVEVAGCEREREQKLFLQNYTVREGQKPCCVHDAIWEA